MILVRDRRTEQGEDSVAGGLHDVAVVMVHRVDHQVQGRIYQGARRFGIEFLHQIHRTLDIFEQCSNGLPLFVARIGYGSLGRYTNCALRRCVTPGRKRLGRDTGLKSHAALSAEFEWRWILESTL